MAVQHATKLIMDDDLTNIIKLPIIFKDCKNSLLLYMYAGKIEGIFPVFRGEMLWHNLGQL